MELLLWLHRFQRHENDELKHASVPYGSSVVDDTRHLANASWRGSTSAALVEPGFNARRLTSAAVLV